MYKKVKIIANVILMMPHIEIADDASKMGPSAFSHAELWLLHFATAGYAF